MIVPPRRMAPGEHLTAANYNALLDYVRRITPISGANIAVDYRLGGAVISGSPVSIDRTTKPFAVRLHKTEDDPGGQWEIYLPPGCCNVGGTCEPLNPPANETSGHEDDAPAWRSLGKLDFGSMTKAYTESGNGSIQAIRGVVEVHVKPSAKIYGVDSADAPARRLVWVCVRDDLYREYILSHYSAQAFDQVLYRDTAGDCFSCDVATITANRFRELVNGSYKYDEWSNSVAQNRSVPIDINYYAWAPPADSGVTWSHSFADPCFGLVWNFAVSVPSSGYNPVQPGGLKLDVRNLFCVRQVACAAGITVTGDDMTDVLDATAVYARLDVTDLNTGSGIVEVLKDPTGTDVATPYVIWLPLYNLKRNTVVADHRPQSLVNIQIYHA